MSSSMPYDSTESLRTSAIVAEHRKTERLLWWLAIAGAAVSIVLGVMVLAWPHATLFVGAALFGAWLLVHGVIHIVNAVTATAADGAARALSAVVGVLFVIAGVVCLRNLFVSLLAIATIIGVTWLIGGIVGLVSAFGGHYDPAARTVVGLLGAITVLGGLVVLLWPAATLLTIIYLTGIWLVVIGAIELFLVLRTRPSAA
jgi:uncharacterized membrane protein HdeD (DUF308 family)